jgi:hypothetical protein
VFFQLDDEGGLPLRQGRLLGEIGPDAVHLDVQAIALKAEARVVSLKTWSMEYMYCLTRMLCQHAMSQNQQNDMSTSLLTKCLFWSRR